MAVKRVIMILAASLEFDKKHNSEIIERESDNEEIPQVKFLYCDLFLRHLLNTYFLYLKRNHLWSLLSKLRYTGQSKLNVYHL